MNNYLTIKELSVQLKVSKRTIHNWKKQGILPYHQIGRRILISNDDVNKLMNANKINSNYTSIN